MLWNSDDCIPTLRPGRLTTTSVYRARTNNWHDSFRTYLFPHWLRFFWPSKIFASHGFWHKNFNFSLQKLIRNISILSFFANLSEFDLQFLLKSVFFMFVISIFNFFANSIVFFAIFVWNILKVRFRDWKVRKVYNLIQFEVCNVVFPTRMFCSNVNSRHFRKTLGLHNDRVKIFKDSFVDCSHHLDKCLSQLYLWFLRQISFVR